MRQDPRVRQAPRVHRDPPARKVSRVMQVVRDPKVPKETPSSMAHRAPLVV